jgi:hypothetical protein
MNANVVLFQKLFDVVWTFIVHDMNVQSVTMLAKEC